MKTTKIISLLILLIALLSITSCVKDECKGESPYNYNDVRLKKFFFQPGSYWVYQNTTTNQLDSQYVISLEVNFDTNYYFKGCFSEGYLEVRRMLVFSTFYNDTIKYVIFGSDHSLGRGISIYGYGCACYTPDEVNYVGGYPKLTGDYKVLQIGSSFFENVRSFEIDTSSLCQDKSLRYKVEDFFAPNFGLVKRIEIGTPLGNQEWILVRWKLTP